jgi:hypothetical protein
MATHVTRRGSIPAAMGWMISLSILLFWMPFFGGLIAGFVGGRRAGGIGPAVVAAVLPGVILFLVSFFLGGLLGWIPIIGQLIGLLLGTGAFALSFMNVIPLLIGAVVGGATVDR